MRCFINLIFIRLLLLLDKKGCVHGHTSFVTCKIKCSYVHNIRDLSNFRCALNNMILSRYCDSSLKYAREAHKKLFYTHYYFM